MEFRHLRYFVGVGEDQHFGRAAERLHLAQPALSRQIQDLERELGFALFDRLPRGVRLNEAGKLFLTDVRRILQDVDDAKLRAERIALGKVGTLRIGIATAISWHGIVVDSFREFRRRQPDAEIELHHLLSIRQVEAIASGKLDAGFASLIPLGNNLAHLQFAEDRIVLAVPKEHPLTKRKTVRLMDLRNMPFIWVHRWSNPVIYDQMMQACALGGLSSPPIVQLGKEPDNTLAVVGCPNLLSSLDQSTPVRP